MSVTIIEHRFDKQSATEYLIFEDSHGRRHHVQVGILDGQDVEELIERERCAFEHTERKITDHIARRFNPITLQRRGEIK